MNTTKQDDNRQSINYFFFNEKGEIAFELTTDGRGDKETALDDLADAQQELIAAQEEIKRLKEALQNLVNFYDDPKVHITKEPQVMKDARKALKDD